VHLVRGQMEGGAETAVRLEGGGASRVRWVEGAAFGLGRRACSRVGVGLGCRQRRRPPKELVVELSTAAQGLSREPLTKSAIRPF
jgi:hypothetical protein